MKILVIKPSSLGDVIHALPFLKSVKNTFPDARVDWVISRDLIGLIEDNPLIERIHTIDKESWKRMGNLYTSLTEILSLRKTLRTEHYDLVVDLQGLLRSGIIAHFASGSKTIGFADAREGSRLFYDVKIPIQGISHAVDRCLEAARIIGAEVKTADFPLSVNVDFSRKIKELIGNNDEYIIIAPSARWQSKRWPSAHFASLISRLTIQCIVIGSKDDMNLVNQIMTGTTGNAVNFCGKTDLKELVALISGSRAVVSNDSGPMHIAAALEMPTIALFGPTDPGKTGPYGWQSNKKLKVIRADIPCSPCRTKECADLICMNSIQVESVLAELEEYVN
jgi:lipopolysaccharide heptosyltransferase I